ncbi:MAG: hypothetical protein EPN70_20455 [Paraburkholderia sp.]|nr:hypothetical protein [Paraburkholderia sp.]TAM01119.1 MAG: hypothetical protein EPN70_20455 [Paraburkholderia sp.]TAM30392.1 MAG: hypothetical protein EPN59_09545 [Paraburkholderia sp.]
MKSPITGAGFKIKAVGVGGIRHGRIGGYWLSANIPACVVGHNRELVNGVYWAAKICFALLRNFLASRGCTVKGLSYIEWGNVFIGPFTLTYLEECESRDAALELLNDIRQHVEAVLNHGPHSRPGMKAAYVKPDGAEWPEDVFTLYIRDREFGIALYVKQPGVAKAFSREIDEPELESEVAERSGRTVRIEVTPHKAWLAENDLDKPENWRNNPDAYKKVFGLMRVKIQLGRSWRVKRMQKTSVRNLSLSQDDKTCLLLHLSGKDPGDYPVLNVYPDANARSKRFSAIRKRVFDETGIDLRIPWRVQQAGVRPGLASVFEYPGEFEPHEHLRTVVYSKTTAPAAYERLEELTAELLRAGAHSGADEAQGASGESADVVDDWSDPVPKQGAFDGWQDEYAD